jgi:adenylate kinase family enzyme
VRRIAVVASASGNGKTTVGRQLASTLGVPFVELDALVHGPGWTETSDERLRVQLAPILASDGWVIDGNYERKLGRLVLSAADLVVWLDLPIYVWLPRLAARTWRRIRVGEQLWNGNRETVAGALWGRDALFVWALRSHFRHRRDWPRTLRDFHVVRLRTQLAVEQFLDEVRAASS